MLAEKRCDAGADDAEDQARHGDRPRRLTRADIHRLRGRGRRFGHPRRRHAVVNAHANAGAQPEAHTDVGHANPYLEAHTVHSFLEAHGDRNDRYDAHADLCADRYTLLLRQLCALPDDTAAL